MGNWDHLGLASKLNWGRAGLCLVGFWLPLEGEVNALIGDAKKGGVYEDVSVVIG